MKSNVNNENLLRHLSNLERALTEVIPKYLELVGKDKLNKQELSELGELEYFLMDIDSRIKHITQMLEQQLYGSTMERMLKMKDKARSGSLTAKLKYDEMRKSFQEMLTSGVIFEWN